MNDEKINELKNEIRKIVTAGDGASGEAEKLLNKLTNAIENTLIELDLTGIGALQTLYEMGITDPGKYKVILKKYKEHLHGEQRNRSNNKEPRTDSIRQQPIQKTSRQEPEKVQGGSIQDTRQEITHPPKTFLPPAGSDGTIDFLR